MGYARQKFEIITDTGGSAGSTVSDTGPPIFGELQYMLAQAGDTAGTDTGANVRGFIVPVDGNDSGDSFIFLNTADLGATDQIFAPRVQVGLGVGAVGSTTDSGEAVPYILAGDRIRLEVTAGSNRENDRVRRFYLYFKT